MGKMVNVVTSAGKVVSVPEEDAALLAPESRESQVERGAALAAESRHSGILETGGALLEGAADVATLGGYGKVEHWISPEAARMSSERAAEHPTARGLGELAAFAAPGAEFTGIGLARGAGPAIGLGAQASRVVEGAILGAGGAVAHSNVTGDPLTIEALAEGAGVGGILNLGAGFLGDSLVKRGHRAGWAAEEYRRATASAEKGAALFENDSAAWNELRDARAAAESDVRATNTETRATQAKFDKWIEGNGPVAAERVFKREFDRINAEHVQGANLLLPENEAARTALRDVQGYRRRLETAMESRADNPETTLSQMHDLASAMRSSYRALTPELPIIPGGGEIPLISVDLPASLKGVPKMHADTISKWAGILTQREADALEKLRGELGLQPGVNPAATLAGVHRELKSYAADIAGLADTTHRVPSTIRWLLRRAGSMTAGGFLGSMTPIPGARLAGSILGYAAADAFSSIAMEAKAGLSLRLRDLVARYAGPAGRTTTSLGPVMAYLGIHFPSGKPDPETDVRKQAANRVRDILGAAATGSDTAYKAVQPLLEEPSDVALKLHGHVMGAVSNAAQAAPRDPGLLPRGFTSGTRPTLAQSVALAHRLEALQDPLGAIERALAGQGHPAATDALWRSWHAIMDRAAEEVNLQGANLSLAPLLSVSGFSDVVGSPMSALRVPLVASHIQGLYLPKPPASPSPGSGGIPGRPPTAGRNPVAGSNVQFLTQG